MHNKEFELSKYRFSQAKETYENAVMSIENGFYRDCINRSYYAVFYAVKAILVLVGVDFKRHKDVVAYFNKEFVASGIFPRDLGKRIGRLKTMREECDYDDFVILSKEEAQEQLDTVVYALPLIEEYLSDRTKK